MKAFLADLIAFFYRQDSQGRVWFGITIRSSGIVGRASRSGEVYQGEDENFFTSLGFRKNAWKLRKLNDWTLLILMEIRFPLFLMREDIVMNLDGKPCHILRGVPLAWPLRIRPPDMDFDDYLFRGDRAYSMPSIYPFKQCACWLNCSGMLFYSENSPKSMPAANGI